MSRLLFWSIADVVIVASIHACAELAIVNMYYKTHTREKSMSVTLESNLLTQSNRFNSFWAKTIQEYRLSLLQPLHIRGATNVNILWRKCIGWIGEPQLDMRLQSCFGGSTAVNYANYSMRTNPGTIGLMQKCRSSTSTVGSAADLVYFFGCLN